MFSEVTTGKTTQHIATTQQQQKKGNFSGTKVLPWSVPLSLERERGTYVKHACHLHRSVGMCAYSSI